MGSSFRLGPSTECGEHNRVSCAYDPPCDDHRQRHWAAENLVDQLHVAVRGDTWARPEAPADVWRNLLDEVHRLREKGGRFHELRRAVSEQPPDLVPGCAWDAVSADKAREVGEWWARILALLDEQQGENVTPIRKAE